MPSGFMERKQSAGVSELKGFAKGVFEVLGGVVEPLDADTFEILVPDEYVSYFQGQNTFRLQFSVGHHTAQNQSCEVFTVGSKMFDCLIALFSEKGRFAKAYLNPLRLEAQNIEEKFCKRIHLLNAKLELKSQSPEETATAVFCFKVSFLTDDKTEQLFSTAVNLTTCRQNESLLEEWDHIFLDAEPSYHGIASFHLSGLEPAYEKAKALVKQKIVPELDKIKAMQEKFLRRDLVRIEDYYAHLVSELHEKERRSQENDAVLEKISHQKKAFELDRRKKFADAQEKYRLDVEIKLVNLLILYQPWIHAVMAIRTHAGEIERSFFWDPVLKAFDMYCESCSQNCHAFFVRGQKLICTECDKQFHGKKASVGLPFLHDKEKVLETTA